MNNIIEQMLQQYSANTVNDRKNSIKEVVQEVVLCGLSRAGFFNNAAFYGGTALRIFYGLDRFSEDLDFSLIKPDEEFDITSFFPILEREIRSYGLNFKVEVKEKSVDSDIKSAFLKGNTKEHIMLFYAEEQFLGAINKNELIKVRFEVDINPPEHANFEKKYRLLPIPYELIIYDMPSLFAGKIHAVLCRAWKNRVKGRDLYDYVFYLSRGTAVNLQHVTARLVQTGHVEADSYFSIEDLKDMLRERFENIDYAQAKQDVLPFINNPKALDIWSPEFFIAITNNLNKEETL